MIQDNASGIERRLQTETGYTNVDKTQTNVTRYEKLTVYIHEVVEVVQKAVKAMRFFQWPVLLLRHGA